MGMPAPRIFDRVTFFEVLDEAQALTQQLCKAEPSAVVLQQIEAQLMLIRRSTEAGQVPDEQTRARVDIGPIAVRDYEGKRDDYAEALKELNYAYRRYQLLLERPPQTSIVGADQAEEVEPPEPAPRRGIVQVLYGPEAFRKHVINAGERVVVGRDARAQLMLSRDKELAARHLELWWDGIVCHVRDLDSPSGITLDGAPAWRGEVHNGGVIGAAKTTLRFFVENHSQPEQPIIPGPTVTAARAQLLPRWQQGQLYAVIDAARSRRTLRLLEEATDEHASLYEGDRGRALDVVAPYLVHLSPDSALLDRLLLEGWGDAWGIWLASRSAPKMVRRSLRRLLVVEVEGRRDRLYFRYYDPRVLSRLVPLLTVRQKSEILAEVDAIYFEDAAGGAQVLERQEASAVEATA